MTHHEAFLRDICERPDDDDVRLIFADWLTERADAARGELESVRRELANMCCHQPRARRGDFCNDSECAHCHGRGETLRDRNGELSPVGAGAERAEFLRVQIALANWPCECDEVERVYHDECRCKEKGELQRRQRDLLEQHRKSWTALVDGLTIDAWSLAEPMLPYVYGVRAKFQRGFIAEITLTTAAFFQHAAALFAAAPITKVRFANWLPMRLDVTNHPRVWVYSQVFPDGSQPSPEFNTAIYETHATEEVALQSASIAAVAYGRQVAGLPAFPTEAAR